MSKKGIVRKLDNLGRLVIPKEIRKSHGFKKNKPILINIKENYIEITKYNKGCIFCGNENNLTTFNDHLICNECIDKIKQK